MLTYLKEPLSTDKITLKNRLVMPSMATGKSDNGLVTDEIIDYYDEKSRGGHLGLVIIEHAYVSLEGKAGKGQVSVADDECLEGLKRLLSAIHKNGTPAVMQINHGGSAAKEEITGRTPVGPSAVEHPLSGIRPRELSKEDILRIEDDFVQAAVRVKKAGFDGVEIHSVHGYLLNQFLSPLTNRRTDEYGGSLENRIRIHLEILRKVRNAVGPDFPIFLRLAGSDYREDGITLDESKIAAGLLEKAGIDLFDISGGFCLFSPPEGVAQEGHFSELTAGIKEAVSVPVMLTGGIVTPEAAEKLIKDKKADLIGVGRALLKDSLWAKKAMGY